MIAASRGEIEISVVSPMYNEELCLGEFIRRTDEVLGSLTDGYEIIIVDDGSTDATSTILADLAAENPRLRPVTLARNTGQWAALYAGLQASRGTYVVAMDGDLQHLPEEIPLLIEEIRKGYDLVSGSRGARKESFLLRRLPSLVANYLLRLTTGCPIRDMGGFKCLRGEVARQLRLRAGQHRLLPALVSLLGGRLSEVTVSAPPRFAGKSHYGLSRSLDVLFDIVMLWFQNSFKARPLYLFGRVSLWLFVFGSMVMSWLLYEKIALGEPMGTRPPFIACVVVFIASGGFMSVGFVLELLSDTLNAVTDTKPYMLRRDPTAAGTEKGRE